MNITEQIISKETAILAKEKGFNWKVKAYYSLDRLWTGSNVPLIDYNNTNNIIYEKIFISVPTQSLLQKWLRDIHNIDIDVSPRVGIYHVLVFKNRSLEKFNDGFSTYEQALEEGLKQALNLINNKL